MLFSRAGSVIPVALLERTSNLREEASMKKLKKALRALVALFVIVNILILLI